MSDNELERLRKIERLAREVVKPNTSQAHQAALEALREAILEINALSQQELRRGAVTMRIIEPNKE